MKMDLCKLFAVVLFCLSLSGCNSCTGKKDGSRSDIIDNNTDEKNYEFTFNGIRMNSDMSLEDLKRVNPDIRIERNKTPGFNSIIGSSEPYTYYEVYSPSEDRACVIVPYKNNSEIYSITFLTDDYKTPENICIGSTWGEVEKIYPNGEWQFYYWAFDYYTYSYYENWIYYYVPSICSYFVFKGSQFSETQIEALYSSVSNDDISVSSESASIYSSICSSVAVYQIVAVNCNHAEQPHREAENELIGTSWEHFHNNASSGDKTTEISFIDGHNMVIRNFPPPERVNVSESDVDQLAKIKRVDVNYYYDSNTGTGYYISTEGEKISFTKNSNTITVDLGSDVFVFYKK